MGQQRTRAASSRCQQHKGQRNAVCSWFHNSFRILPSLDDDLQKKIKKLPHKEQMVQQQGASDSLTEEETEFVQALSDTLNELNEIYIEKEETSVIRVERLESGLATATTPEQLNDLHKQFVDFHGEVLLLVHWSILAYTATVKILKKHHKRTGLLVKAPQLGNLLSQPFCSTEVCAATSQKRACSSSGLDGAV